MQGRPALFFSGRKIGPSGDQYPGYLGFSALPRVVKGRPAGQCRCVGFGPVLQKQPKRLNEFDAVGGYDLGIGNIEAKRIAGLFEMFIWTIYSKAKIWFS